MRPLDAVRQILRLGGGSHVRELFFSGPKSVVIPSSVNTLCKSSVPNWASVESVTVEGGSHLQRIEEPVFSKNRFTSMIISSSLEVLCKFCFPNANSFHQFHLSLVLTFNALKKEHLP
jgi:hypothetical protein